MGSLLELEGKVRLVKTVAWVVFLGGPRDITTSEIFAGGFEILQENTVTREIHDEQSGKTSYIRAVESHWLPERFRRLLVKRWPTEVFQTEDLKIFQGHPDKYLVLTSEREKDAYIARRRKELEAEGKVAEAKRIEADRKFVEEREAEIAKLRGEP